MMTDDDNNFATSISPPFKTMKLSYALTIIAAAAVNAVSTIMEPSITFDPPLNWEKTSHVSPNQEVTVRLLLKQDPSSVKSLHDTLLAVSTPGNPEYGNHKTKEEIKAILSLSPSSTKTVSTHFEDIGEVSVNSYGDVITVKLPSSAAASAFNCELATFTHKESGATVVRSTTPYKLDESIADLVSVVEGLVRFPTIRSPPTTRTLTPPTTPTFFDEDDVFNSCKDTREGDSNDLCKDSTTPAVLKEAYSINLDGFKLVDGNRMAVAEFQGQYYNSSDLTLFSSHCGVEPAVEVAADVGDPNNETSCHGNCVESLMDIQYIKAIAPEVPLDVYYTSDYDLTKFTTDLNDMDDGSFAQVYSVSYGNDEIQQVSGEYMDAVNLEFMKIGARGISVLFASGDMGVWGRTGCRTTDTNKRYHPDFPAGSPYVTSVGGTDFLVPNVVGEERAWISGGGGFSDRFPIPEWQADAVAGYKSLNADSLPDISYYNDTGRGYPDVAALGGLQNEYCVANNGRFVSVAGTSASAPVVAGIVALLNNYRLENGGSVLGFLNPWLYSTASEGFNDVVVGNNNATCSVGGFNASAGWDPTTGLGTPNMEKLLTFL